MTPRILFLSWVLSVSPLHAAFEEKPVSARAAALGGAAAGDAEDPDGWLANPAALRFASRPRVLLGHTKLLGEASLPFSTAALSVPGRWAGWGVLVTDFGNSIYREREVSAAAAFPIAPSAAAGVSVTGSFLNVARYGGGSAFGLDAGVEGRPHRRLSLGVAVKRLNRPGLPGARDALPSQTRAGAALTVLPSAKILMDVVKSRDRPFVSRVGVEVSPAPILALRLGGESRPSRFTLGMGVKTSFGSLDYAFSSHPFLGDQHHLSLGFEWGNK
jgi:hypothetical protein